MNTYYAVESYDSDENVFSRHEVGSKEEMKELLHDLVEHDLKEGNSSRYYRVNTITNSDKKEWDRQVEYLPDVPNTEKLFGDWVQINTAAKYLNVTFGRVFNLVTSGDIKASSTLGRNKLVSVHDVVDRKINPPRAGRPHLDME